jgi:hypothetical protein
MIQGIGPNFEMIDQYRSVFQYLMAVSQQEMLLCLETEKGATCREKQATRYKDFIMSFEHEFAI